MAIKLRDKLIVLGAGVATLKSGGILRAAPPSVQQGNARQTVQRPEGLGLD